MEGGETASKSPSVYIYQKPMVPSLPANICMWLKQKIFNNAYCHFAIHYVSNTLNLLCVLEFIHIDFLTLSPEH